MFIKQNKIFRRAVRVIISFSIFLSLSLTAYYFFWLSPHYEVPILTYHYFGYDSMIEGKNLPLLFVAPDNFEKQMHYIKEKGYQVISLELLVEGLKKGRKFPHNMVVITIDDGHKSVFTYAYPILKKYDFPATIFLIADYIENKEDYLNWNEISEMSNDNISFGGHTKSHAYLPMIKKRAVLWAEIVGCKKIIEKKMGRQIDYFCYPTGGFTEEVKTFVKRSGYKGACTTNCILDEASRDVYALDRISIRNHNPYFSFSNLYQPISFRAKLSGYYNLFRKRNSIFEHGGDKNLIKGGGY